MAAAVDAAPMTEDGVELIVEVSSDEARDRLLELPGVEPNLVITDDLVAVSVADEAALMSLADAGDLRAVEPDARVTAFYPADPSWPADCSGQQMLAVTACSTVPSAGAEPDWSTTLWRDTPGGQDVRIAVIDTGIDATHPDLAGRVTEMFQYLPGITPDNSHGTLVARIAAGRGGNGVASAGVAWNAPIYSYEVLGQCYVPPPVEAPPGTPGTWVSCGTTSGLVAAIYYAADDGADVINMSLGSYSAADGTALQDAIAYARNRGVILVAAAGNYQNDFPGVTVYPASLPGVIAVGAVTPTGVPETFSSRSATWVDVSAPDRVPEPGSCDPTFSCGTSFSAPRVAGLVALMHSYDGDITEAEALALLQGNVLPFNGDGTGMGSGIVSGTAVIGAMQAQPGVCDNTTSGYVLDGYGGRHPAGAGQPLPTTGGNYWPGWDIARGMALLPNDQGGYVVDGWGGIHPFGIAGGGTTPLVHDNPYWPGWDIVRDVAVLPDGTGGYVLDGWGGVHPFRIGDNIMPSLPVNNPYWPGWDVARSLVLTSAGGGYVLDGWGGIHPFQLTGGAMPPAPSGNAYWPGWDIARGIALVPGQGGGYVVDGYGGLHPFTAGGSALGSFRNNPYWYGWNIVRDVATRAVCG